MKRIESMRVCFAALLVLCVPASADELGNIAFPNSGAPEAQQAFLTGVKALHSFQFDEARFAFEEAQRIDPDFALAYWGQAMSDNHPLWAQQDRDAASAALKRLAPDLAGRLEKAGSDKERAYLQAVDILYFSPGDKLTRDEAYADFMAGMHERWPDDDEIAIFRALSLLGTVRPGDRGFRRQAQAAAIALEVFDRNPEHPGAAHFAIHAFDDPDHAILALPAARVYADIAPAAAHALHMPSHIFLQLGMWDRVVLSNIDAYAAAVATNEKYGLPEGREDFHTLSWLAYANLMLGHFDRAEDNLGNALAAVDRNPGAANVYNGYLEMRARHILETAAWEKMPLGDADSPEWNNPHWLVVAGMSAAHAGDNDTAARAEARLAALSAAAKSDYDARQNEILALQVAAVRAMAEGSVDAAIADAARAADLERRFMRVPSGPPRPVKPAAELHAEMLLAAGQYDDAIVAFEQSLAWIPKRTPSLLGLARAAAGAGDSALAADTYDVIRNMPGANPRGPAMTESVGKSGAGR